MKCLCLRRNHRNGCIEEENNNNLYFNNDIVEEIVTQQILDRIHCKLIHSF